ncbi:hypothetical protein P4234_24245 [Pseudomonas aeruginosa]|nr:hypothetical protein [Pseudomonas aeruginosa]
MKNEVNLKKETDITRRGRLAPLCRKADNDALEFRGVRRHIAEWSELVGVRRQSGRAAPDLPGFVRGSSGVGYCL